MTQVQTRGMNINSKPIYILGISGFYHDAAACLLKDGEIIAAAAEERFTRKKHDGSFPENAANFCLRFGGITSEELSAVVFYDKPLLKFERLLTTYLQVWPRAWRSFTQVIPLWLLEKIHIPYIVKKKLQYKGPVYFVPHHVSHAASSFFASPFEEAAILTVDGIGEWASTTWGVGKGTEITVTKEIHFPDSLGLLYSAFTYYLGFKVNSAEYKVMGAAPYGKPVYVEKIKKHLIDIKGDGSFRLNMKYVNYEHSLVMVEKEFEKLFGMPVRNSEKEPMTEFHWDIAASIQAITEEVMIKLVNHIHQQTGLTTLCMAGGVALNCVANGRILRETKITELFIQPAAGDDGGALGAALYYWHTILKNPRQKNFTHPYWGSAWRDEDIEKILVEKNIPFEKVSDEVLFDQVSEYLGQQAVVGWFQGRSEFGPRSLGNRSILADARNYENWQRVNLKIKFRESFRPFAPSVLKEKANEYFDLVGESPYMLLVAPVRSTTIPAVTHVDKSARIQTVDKETNPRYYQLIENFEKKTGCAVLINTSFNVRGEPIVDSPRDAINCFLRTDMDYLVMHNYIIAKKDTRKVAHDSSWMNEFTLD